MLHNMTNSFSNMAAWPQFRAGNGTGAAVDLDPKILPMNVIRTNGDLRWPIVAAIVLLVMGFRTFHYFFIFNAPPKGLKRIPGPRSTIPWIGRVHDVDLNAPWHAWRKFPAQYGGMCSSTIAGDMHIWVSDPKIARELLCNRARKYSSRPEIAAVPGSNTQRQYLPLLAHGEHWRHQRKFATTLLTHASGRKFDGYITHEAKRFLYKLLEDPSDHHSLTDRYCGRIAARMGYGRPDSGAAHCKNAAEFIPTLGPAGSITNRIPPFGKLPEWLNSSKREVRIRREKEEKLWKGLLAQVRHEMDQGVAAPFSYARAYLEQKQRDSDSKAFNFDDHEAAYAVGMLVTVAIFTIGGPLYCFMLCMVLHPEWQIKVRKELDKVVGDRVVELSDSPQLPILRAAIKECMRWRPTVPLGVPRLVQEDDAFNGYHCPKGAVVHAVELAMARDEELYPDADNFRPERWLDASFPTYKEPLTEHPHLMGYHGFGMGQRMCIGIDLTECELLVACGSIVGAFDLNPAKDEHGVPCPPPSYDWVPNLIGGPLPFQMDLKPRSAAKAARIRLDYATSLEAEGPGTVLQC